MTSPAMVLTSSVTRVPSGEAWLGTREQRAQEALLNPKRREDWRLGRYTVKALVARRLGLDCSERWLARVEVLPAADGAPVAHLDGAPLDAIVSLSHREGIAIAAMARAPIGCDLEAVEERSAAFVETFFTESEARLVDDAPGDERPLLANLIWSAKESVLKALRYGLSRDTRRIDVLPERVPDESGWARFSARVALEGSPARLPGFWRLDEQRITTICCMPGSPAPQTLHEEG